ncbi:MAG TPA: hypothetical protein VM925_18225 [Labilithrix sp.]|nr:hypothetical protein [Labilithrix sp.]
MDDDLEESRKSHEVLVGRENGQAAPRGDGADQEVGIRSLNAARPATIETASGLLIISTFELEVGERTQADSQLVELRGVPYAREKLLSHGPYHDHPAFSDELSELEFLGTSVGRGAAEGR